MKKREWVYREVLYRVFEKGENFFTQKNLSEAAGISIGNVYKSLAILENINAIEKTRLGFRVVNPRKILLYWASIRNLEKDIVFRAFVPKPVEEIEKSLPPLLFTAYSGFKFRFGKIPSDYSEVVVYGEREGIEERFGKKAGKENLFVLKADAHLKRFKTIPLAQLYVDLWNLGTWYAQEFLNALEKKIKRG